MAVVGWTRASTLRHPTAATATTNDHDDVQYMAHKLVAPESSGAAQVLVAAMASAVVGWPAQDDVYHTGRTHWV